MSSDDGEEELEAGVAEVDVGFADGAVDACCVEDSCHEVGQDRVAAPLAESREPASSHHPVEVGSLVEDLAVVPPALVGAIQFKELLILRELKSDPDGLAIALTVPVGKLFDRFLGLASCVQPSWRLRNEESEHDDETREDHLQPDR